METHGLSSTPQLPTVPAPNPQSLFQTSFQKKYTQLIGEEQSLWRFVRKIIALLSKLLPFLKRESPWQAHIAAEHLGEESRFIQSTKTTIDFLQSLDSKTPTPQIQNIIAPLQFALSIVPYGLILQRVDHTQKRIQQLKKGDSILIPAQVTSHMMVMQISCVEDTPKKIYKITHYNTGGIDYHHMRKNSSGKIQYQTALEISGVSENALIGSSSSFFQQLYSLPQLYTGKNQMIEAYQQEIEQLYGEILPQLGGRIEPPSTNDALWQRKQLGFSCTTSCGLAFIRAQMTKEEWQTFKALARTDVFYKSYQDITDRGDKTTTRQSVVALDALLSLQKTLSKHRLELPKDLVSKQHKLESLGRPLDTSLPYDKQILEQTINELLNHDTLRDQKDFVTQLLSRAPLTEEQKEKIPALSQALEKIYQIDSLFSLSIRQTFVLGALLSKIGPNTLELPVLNRCKQLGLEKYPIFCQGTFKPLLEMIQERQKTLLAIPEPPPTKGGGPLVPVLHRLMHLNTFLHREQLDLNDYETKMLYSAAEGLTEKNIAFEPKYLKYFEKVFDRCAKNIQQELIDLMPEPQQKIFKERDRSVAAVGIEPTTHGL